MLLTVSAIACDATGKPWVVVESVLPGTVTSSRAPVPFD